MSASRLSLFCLFSLSLLLSSCFHPVNYVPRESIDKEGSSVTELIATCPYCEEYADYKSSRCLNCQRIYIWTDRPVPQTPPESQ